MKKFVFSLFCVVAVLPLFTVTAKRVLAQLDCWKQTNSVCDGALDLEESCNETCQFIPAREGSSFGVYECRDSNGERSTPGPVEIVASEFSTVVASDSGYCNLMADQPDPVYCTTVYQCSKTCTTAMVGDLCGAGEDGEGAGSLVQPESVDWETPCPYYCDD